MSEYLLPPHKTGAHYAINLGERPGTPQFFPALLNHIKDHVPAIPIEPVILQSVLLCLLAGPGRHLLLRTREEDVGVVQSLAALLLTDVLSYKTHKHKLGPSLRPSPSTFLSSLFFSQKQRRISNSSRQSSPFRIRARRSRSYPLPAGPDTPMHRRPSTTETDGNASPALRPDELGHYKSLSRPNLRAGAQSDPTEMLGHSVDSPIVNPAADAELPSALVLSGLEQVSVPCQRALLHALLEQRVVLDPSTSHNGVTSWNLPDDFFLVCVCPWDPRERPTIHKSLLDKFSLSATIGLHSSTRQAYASYLSSLLPSSSQNSHPPATHSPSPPVTVPPLPTSLIPRLQELSSPTHVNLHPTLRLYIADLFAAARHYHELDGTLLSARAMQDAEALVRAHRVLGGGTINLVERAAILEEEALEQMRLQSQSALSDTYESSARGLHTLAEEANEADINDGRQVQVHIDWGDGDAVSHSTRGLSTPSVPQSTAPGFAKQPSATSLVHSEVLSQANPPQIRLERGPVEWLHIDPAATWDVSEIDVAKVVPRVLSHRLRVRDGPEDEILSSVMFTAVPAIPALSGAGAGDAGEGEKEVWRRRTIKEILVKLMGEV